jgi:predicted nuclease of predicted toxin-antitoxin system
MRFLFDQNISHRILSFLPDHFRESVSVKSCGLINSLDRVVWEFAREHKYTIVTQDSDFNDLNLVFGFPPKIIWLRTGNLRTQQIVSLLQDYKTEITNFLDDETHGCLEILKVRS